MIHNFKFRKKRMKPWQRKPNIFANRKPYFFKKNKSGSAKNFKNGLLIALIFFVAYFIFFSEFFIIKKIDINGNKTISNESIEEIIKNESSNPILAVFPGNNFFLTSEKKIKERLLSEFSEIKTITIKKKLPNTIKAEIIEKNPLILWCRIENCYYLDAKGTAFMAESNSAEIYKDKKFIKIIEELEIKEEIEAEIEREKKAKENESALLDNIQNTIDSEISDNPELDEKEDDKKNEDKNIILEPIKINDKVADEDFIDFILKLDSNIKSDTDLKIKYYKTKGVKTREIIAYTNKNIRIYFNATDDARSQITYLKDFLSKGIGKNEINTLEYIYLKSGNKIFYK